MDLEKLEFLNIFPWNMGYLSFVSNMTNPAIMTEPITTMAMAYNAGSEMIPNMRTAIPTM